LEDAVTFMRLPVIGLLAFAGLPACGSLVDVSGGAGAKNSNLTATTTRYLLPLTLNTTRLCEEAGGRVRGLDLVGAPEGRALDLREPGEEGLPRVGVLVGKRLGSRGSDALQGDALVVEHGDDLQVPPERRHVAAQGRDQVSLGGGELTFTSKQARSLSITGEMKRNATCG
jgi:hypothetical protein